LSYPSDSASALTLIALVTETRSDRARSEGRATETPTGATAARGFGYGDNGGAFKTTFSPPPFPWCMPSIDLAPQQPWGVRVWPSNVV
jgi:hypothetical protein